MAIFDYKAKNKKGKIKKGKAVGSAKSEAIKNLNKRGLEVISLKESTGSIDNKITSFLNPIKSKDLVIFSRQFSIMMSSNVPMTEALITIVEQTDNFKFKNIISQVAYEIGGGASLSDSLKKHANIFSDFYCNVVRAGETSGKLDEVLNYLADEIEKDYDLTRKFKGALIYPVFVISGLIATGFIFMFFVLPELTKILEETGATLPLATRIVINVSEFLQNYYILAILIVASLIVAIKFLLKTEFGRKRFDIFIVNLPLVGKLFQLIYLVRFSRSLSTLLRGGVNVNKSLEIVAAIIKNTVYKDIISQTIEEVNEGGSIVAVLESSDHVPKMIPEMMLVGEKTGKLEEVLEEIAKFYDKDISNKLNNLSTILEPAIMVIMGIGVGIMVAAVILPMYNIANQF